jgi:glyceraldehyde 3-phosphate dehydrogenase
MINVAINGFGRIGRVFLRAALERKKNNFTVKVINDLGDAENAAYLFKHDSTYGLYKGNVESKKGMLFIDGKGIKIISEREPEKINWKKLGVDVIVESTGAFTKKADAMKHIKSGAKKVLITAPSDDADATIVLGVNDKDLKKEHIIISLGSCTTNCLAPVVKILNDEFGIERAFYNTIHAYTNDQNLHDGTHRKRRRGRAAAQNMLPTNSGASVSVTQAIPELEGKLNGLAIRVPVICGSITDLTASLKKPFTEEQVNSAFKKASQGKMKGILEYSTEELVSSDIIGNKNSSIVDSLNTMKEGNLVKVLSWYDNEYGYSNRMVDFLNVLKE